MYGKAFATIVLYLHLSFFIYSFFGHIYDAYKQKDPEGGKEEISPLKSDHDNGGLQFILCST